MPPTRISGEFQPLCRPGAGIRGTRPSREPGLGLRRLMLSVLRSKRRTRVRLYHEPYEGARFSSKRGGFRASGTARPSPLAVAEVCGGADLPGVSRPRSRPARRGPTTIRGQLDFVTISGNWGNVCASGLKIRLSRIVIFVYFYTVIPSVSPRTRF